MADSVIISDSVTSIDLTGATFPGTSGMALKIGPVDQGRQTITLEEAFTLGSSVLDAIDRYNTLERLLHDAQAFRAQGLGRRVSLTLQPNGATNAVTFHILKGRTFDLPSLPGSRIAQAYFGPFTLELEVEPFGRGAEVTLVNASGTLRSQNHLTHRYVHHTGASAFSVNLAAQTAGSLWQTTKFSTAPTTVTPQAGDILYFGSTLGTFDRLVMGLSTLAAGITFGTVQFSIAGPNWTTFTPASNSFLNGSNLFGTLDSLGEIVFPAMANWAAVTINGVSALWVRINVTSVSSPTAPVLVNGPVRSVADVASIASTDVDGDVPAAALVHVKNAGATALAGVRAALVTAQLGQPPPPFSIPLLSATTYVPTSGDNPLSVETDTEATCGERGKAALASSLSDAAQRFDGVDDYATLTLVAGDKIDSIGTGSFFVECSFYMDGEDSDPICLVSRWDQAGGNRIFWLGYDGLRLRGMVSTDGSNRRTVNGNTKLKRKTHYMATLEFSSGSRDIRLYLNSDLEAENYIGSSTIRNNQTTALRFAKSVSYSTSDSRNGDAEDFFDGNLNWVMIYGGRVSDFNTDVLGGVGYNFPNDPTTEVARADSANVRALYQMNDNAATTVLVDSATTYAAAKNSARSSSTTATEQRPGVLVNGIGVYTKLVAGNLPPCLLEEYAGSYRVFLAAKQSGTMADITDCSFQLQLNVGDTRLQVGPPAYFPSLSAPASSGYHILDMGTFTLPAAGLYDGHRGSGSAALNAQWSLFVKHGFIVNTSMYLDNLYLFPLDTWYGSYDTFDDAYDSAYALAQNEGLAWNSEGPSPLVYQTTTTGLTVQDRNPFAVPIPTAPRLHPRKAAWLVGVGLRGDATGDFLYRVIGDTMVPTVKAVPRFRALAST